MDNNTYICSRNTTISKLKMKKQKTMTTILAIVLGLVCSSVAIAQTKALSIRFDQPNAGIDDSRLYVQPMSIGSDVPTVELSRSGTVFSADIEPSATGLYRLIYIHNQSQTIIPVYVPSTASNLTVGMTFDGTVPMANDNPDNRALSAMGKSMAAADRQFWQRRSSDPAELKAQLKHYGQVADSTLAAFDCSPTVAQYIKMWGYTSTYGAYISLPNMLGVRPDALPVKAYEVLAKPHDVLDTPMAVLFPIVPTLIANFLPRNASLTVQMDSLYGKYHCREIVDKVGSAIIEKYISRFDYQNKYQEGLDELTAVTVKYNLDRKYLNTFAANRSTIKGSPFPKEVVLKDADGKTMDFSQFRGKYVYIDLWASWCVPCCREVPHLQKLEGELNNADVVFLSISLDQKVDAWKKKMASLGVHGHQWHDAEGKLGNALNVKGIPFFLIYDKEGNLYMYDAPRPSQGEGLRELLRGLH